MRSLSDLIPGQTAVILSVNASTPIALHLLELGLAPGEPITLLRTAPGGDPLEFEFMSYRLAIRRREAAQIQVEEQ